MQSSTNAIQNQRPSPPAHPVPPTKRNRPVNTLSLSHTQSGTPARDHTAVSTALPALARAGRARQLAVHYTRARRAMAPARPATRLTSRGTRSAQTGRGVLILPCEHTITQVPVTVSPYRPAGHDAVQPPDDASANRGLVHTPAHTLVTGSANRPAGHAITQTLVTVMANTPNGHISMQLLPARTYGLTHAVQLSLPAPVHAPHCDAHGWHMCAAASS